MPPIPIGYCLPWKKSMPEPPEPPTTRPALMTWKLMLPLALAGWWALLRFVDAAVGVCGGHESRAGHGQQRDQTCTKGG